MVDIYSDLIGFVKLSCNKLQNMITSHAGHCRWS